MLRHLPLLAALSLGLLSCAGVGPPARSPGRSAELPLVDLPDLQARALLLYLADHRLYETFTVQQALGGDAELRRLLATDLGWSGQPEARPILAGLLLDADDRVRQAAAFGLGLIGDPAAEPALLRLAAEGERAEAELAVEALAKLGTPLVDVLQALAPLPEPERWARLLPALDRFSSDAVVDRARRGLALADADLRARAAYALARRAAPEVLPELRLLLADPDPRLRAWAARGLATAGTDADLQALVPLLADPEALPRIETLAALAARARPSGESLGVRLPGSFEPLFKFFDDPLPAVRLAALEASAAWLPSEELASRLAKIGRDGAPWERGAALTALAARRDPAALALAVAAAGSENAALRARAAAAAGRLRAEVLLATLATDPAGAVRAQALAGRLALGEATDSLAETALADPDVAVRTTALDWLALHPVLPYEILAAATQASVRDDVADSRLAGVRALAARGRAQPLDRGAIVEALETLAQSRDYLLRRAASAALGDLGRAQPPVGGVQGGRGGEVYKDIVLRTARSQQVEIATAKGTLRVRLFCPEAPLTCLSFLQLAAQHAYDGRVFDRLEPGRFIAAGDPRGDGWGGPGYTLRDEVNPHRFVRGTLGMTLAGGMALAGGLDGAPDTAGSRFFITLSDRPELDGKATAFGLVEGGLEVLDRLQPGEAITSVVVR